MAEDLPELDAERVVALARVMGIDLTPARAAEVARRSSDVLAEFATASASRPRRVARRRELDVIRPRAEENRFNAFIHRFDLEATNYGPLAGMTVGIKDLIAISGVPRTRGRNDPTEWELSETDADVVSRILAAGGRLVGTLNLDLWGCGGTGESSEFGLAQNPHGRNRLPGGSSSGSGVAVATGEVDVALGTDTAGSVRIPASWCGVVGLKGTRGAVPARGVIGLDPTLDATGPLARDVDSCARLYEVISGAPLQPPTKKPVIGVVDGADVGCDSATNAALQAARAALSAAGYQVRGVEIKSWSDAWQIVSILLMTSVPYFVRTGFQGRWGLDGVSSPPPESARPHPLLVLWMVVEASLGRRAHDWYRQAQEWRLHLTDEVATAFTTVDILLTPTTLSTAPEAAPVDEEAFLATTSGARTDVSTSTLTAPANITGIPALALPFGQDVDGLPASVQLHGRWLEEGSIFSVARELESRR